MLPPRGTVAGGAHTRSKKPMEAHKEFQVEGIESLHLLLQAAVTKLGVGQRLWRGQPVDRPLLPSVFRPENAHNTEFNMLNRFRLGAGVRHSRLPNQDNLAGWLALAQHYGLPTRLLDWTFSLPTALHFAVDGSDVHDTKDGVLYLLHPFRLNELQLGQPILKLMDDPACANSIADAFNVPTKQSTATASRKILAVHPYHEDLRHIVQQTLFTVHAPGLALDELAEATKVLVKFVIPAKAKARLRDQLRLLGISRSTLFPDLASLAADLRTWRAVSLAPTASPEATADSARKPPG
jgi:hypothetical protein